jgi:hypothetical protein
MSHVLKAHSDAVLDLLDGPSKPGPITICREGYVPSGVTPPYIVPYLSNARPPGDPGNTLNGDSGVIRFRAILHCVGGNADASIAVAQWAETALLDITPVIAGRSCGRIRQESALDPERDESTGRLVFDSTVVYRLRTMPT